VRTPCSEKFRPARPPKVNKTPAFIGRFAISRQFPRNASILFVPNPLPRNDLRQSSAIAAKNTPLAEKNLRL
jgi:hypothetical protein